MAAIPASLMCGALSKSGSPMVNGMTSTPRARARAMSSPILNAFSVPMWPKRRAKRGMLFNGAPGKSARRVGGRGAGGRMIYWLIDSVSP